MLQCGVNCCIAVRHFACWGPLRIEEPKKPLTLARALSDRCLIQHFDPHLLDDGLHRGDRVIEMGKMRQEPRRRKRGNSSRIKHDPSPFGCEILPKGRKRCIFDGVHLRNTSQKQPLVDSYGLPDMRFHYSPVQDAGLLFWPAAAMVRQALEGANPLLRAIR